MCPIIIVQCSWDGLLGERNCFCVWSFWCSELWSVDQTATVQRGNVLDVRGPEWFCQSFCSLWMRTVLGEWGGLYQWFAQQSGLYHPKSSEVRFGWAEPDSYWRAEDGFNDGRVEQFQQLLWQVELPQLVKEVQPLLGLFTMDSMWLSHFRSWEIVVPRNMNDSTAVIVLFMMVSGGRTGVGGGAGVLLKSTIISAAMSVLSSRLLRLYAAVLSYAFIFILLAQWLPNDLLNDSFFQTPPLHDANLKWLVRLVSFSFHHYAWQSSVCDRSADLSTALQGKQLLYNSKKGTYIVAKNEFVFSLRPTRKEQQVSGQYACWCQHETAYNSFKKITPFNDSEFLLRDNHFIHSALSDLKGSSDAHFPQIDMIL